MSQVLEKINFQEAEFFYKSPYALVDYSIIQSFSLIRSTVEVFAYYGITDFTPEDIRHFFERLQLIHRRKETVFIPTAKKVSGVLDCCLSEGKNQLAKQDGSYHIVSWDSSGYGFEIQAAKDRGRIPPPPDSTASDN